MPALGDFPPAEHLGRDLRVAYRFPEPARIELKIPVVKEILRPDGTVMTEALTTVLDEGTGFLAVFSAMPGWSSTASMGFDFPLGPVAPDGEIVVDGRVTKAGKRLIFVEADVRWGDRLIAHAAGEFARVPRANHNRSLEIPEPDPDEISSMALPESGLDRPYPVRLGMETVDEADGVIELSLGSYTRNSGGILHGGVVGALAIAAAERAAGVPAVGAHVQFLSPGRIGPFRTRASLAYERADGARVWHTETFDTGDDDRVMTQARVTTGAA
jgi:acyl-coenzyme A thioesterase PaaI-like protein